MDRSGCRELMIGVIGSIDVTVDTIAIKPMQIKLLYFTPALLRLYLTLSAGSDRRLIHRRIR